MKTRLASVSLGLLCLWSANALADGTVIFSNVGAPAEDRIYYVHWSHSQPGVIDEGPTPLAGSGYHISLHWGPQGTPGQGLVQIGGSTTFLTGSAAGTFSGGERRIVSPDPGPVFTFQARAWSGNFSTYDEAVLSGGG